ncbi:MAG: hypothetical protein D3925_01140 [Candidatus Electrothrix sp. AR5]|nr:hypothetical protein [Candidatus Electrothrix sp. AR5]
MTVSSAKHMRLKESVCKKENDGEVLKRFAELDLFLNDKFQESLKTSCKYIKRYFNGRSKFEPRLTFKAPYRGDYIVDLYREERFPFFQQFRLEENTAFQYVKDTGKYYICNNIPLEVCEGTYKNKRINSNVVKNTYNIPGTFKSSYQKIIGQPERDRPWETCWNPNSNGKHPYSETCYKSTLVVPMTLLNATLCKDFKEYIFCDTQRTESDTYEKLMFGFLCMDHRHSNYFSSESDIRFGYIVADLLSLFLVMRMMCRSRSRTCQRASELKQLQQKVFSERSDDKYLEASTEARRFAS